MNYSEENNVRTDNVKTAVQESLQRTFLTKTFTWMAGALTITAITALVVSHSPQLLSMLINANGTGLSLAGWVVMFAPFILVLVMSGAMKRLSLTAMSLLYIAYSVLMGASLSFIFLAYTTAHIGITFAVTAGTFGFMAVLGYTTKTDLTKFGSILMMALIGIIIAMVVNFFMRSGALDYIISIIGVLVFTGLTAFDVQKLKKISEQIEEMDSTAGKMALMGALTLYLDFINLFLFLLRIFGGRRN